MPHLHGATSSALAANLSLASLTSEATPLAREVARFLPQLSMDDVQRCVARRRPKATLSSCVNLANPGAASLSLTSLLANYSNRTHHYHHLNFKKVVPMSAKRGLPPPECVVLTLRDPAARLASGWRYELIHHGRLRRFWLMQSCRDGSGSGPNKEEEVDPIHPTWVAHRNLTFMVDRFRNGSDHCLNSIYNASAGSPYWPRHMLGGHGDGPAGGDNFLVSQLHYLSSLDCQDEEHTPEVHILCVEHLEEDWAALLERFGFNSTQNMVPEHGRASGRPNAVSLSKLEDADKAFIRDSLYPWDTALHRHFCDRRPTLR